jgi:hypothetical protein
VEDQEAQVVAAAAVVARAVSVQERH